METTFTLVVFLLFFWIGGIALGALLRGIDYFERFITKESSQQHHARSFKIVRNYVYCIMFVFSLFSLFGILAESPTYLGTSMLLFGILLLLSALWGTYIGIGRRYIPPFQFLKMLRK
jgi:hypothetical protein